MTLANDVREIYEELSPLDKDIFATTMDHLTAYKAELESTVDDVKRKKLEEDIQCCGRIIKLLGNRESRKERATLIYNISYTTAIVLKAALKVAIGI